MQDRISLYPGRVKMTPVAGQANTYDMERADDPTQEGTPLNKATFLKDATAALYGLGTGAVPDDVLSKLSKGVLVQTVSSPPPSAPGSGWPSCFSSFNVGFTPPYRPAASESFPRTL